MEDTGRAVCDGGRVFRRVRAVPRGFAADENARPGFTDPRQGFETCGIVEFMHSFELLTRTGGDPVWSDRCEELAFNSLPAALTPDLKALHYLTCANQVSKVADLMSDHAAHSGATDRPDSALARRR